MGEPETGLPARGDVTLLNCGSGGSGFGHFVGSAAHTVQRSGEAVGHLTDDLFLF